MADERAIKSLPIESLAIESLPIESLPRGELSNWILADGTWNDIKFWDDTDFWLDGPVAQGFATGFDDGFE